MIWSNVKLECQEKKFSFGTMPIVEMGEYGRGRELIVIPSTIDIERGWNAATIRLSRSGKPKIDEQSNAGRFLLISTKGGYTRRGDGYMLSMPHDLNVLAVGNGADGAAGRIGYWRAYVAEIMNPNPFWVHIRYGGRNAKSWIRVTLENIIEIPEHEIELYCDQNNLDVPKIEDFN